MTVPLREARTQGVAGVLGVRSPEVRTLAKGCSDLSLAPFRILGQAGQIAH